MRTRAAQFRDQLQRNLAGTLKDDDFRPCACKTAGTSSATPHGPHFRCPYGELSSAQLRVLARVAEEFDRPDRNCWRTPRPRKARSGLKAPPLRYGYGHFTTRTNVQFNWIPLGALPT